MDIHLVILNILDILEAREDTESLITCSQINSQWYYLVKEYKYLENMPTYTYRLINSKRINSFNRSLLKFLIEGLELTTMSDLNALLRMIKMTDSNTSISELLDRIIPDSTKTGNYLIYKPSPNFYNSLENWLKNHAFLDEDQIVDEEHLSEIEEYVDELFRNIAKYKSDYWTNKYKKYKKQVDQDNNIDLFINKLKVIYQCLETQ